MPVASTTTPTPDAALVGALVSLMLRHVRAALPVAAGAVVDRLGADAVRVAPEPTPPPPPPKKWRPKKSKKRPAAAPAVGPFRPAGGPGPSTPDPQPAAVS